MPPSAKAWIMCGCHAHPRWAPLQIDASQPLGITVPRAGIPRYPSRMTPAHRLSIILPARNEAEGLRHVLPALRQEFPLAELIVVDDGSTDETAAIAGAAGARVLSAPYGMGNGAAIKRGARAASGEILVFLDADGQHDPAHIHLLLAKLDQGYDMAVGARSRDGQANVGRGLANGLYNRLASWMTGHRILDLTSGFRAVRADRFREFLHLLPNGFSYPTTSTMAFFRSAYPVAYVPVEVARRMGTSSHPPDQGRGALPVDHLQDRQPVFATEAVRACGHGVHAGRHGVVCVDLPRVRPLHQHEHAVDQRSGDRVPDRAGVGADHQPHVPTRQMTEGHHLACSQVGWAL